MDLFQSCGHCWDFQICWYIECSTFSSVQSLSHVQLFATPWTAECQATLSITNSWNLLKLMSNRSVMQSNHLILCCPLLLLPSNFPNIRVFPKESVLHIRWPKYWRFSFSISPSDEYSELISFRMEWLDLIQGTLKSLLQHHSSKHQFFGSGGQSIGASASASVPQMNIQNWFPLGWTGWISLLSKGLLRVSSTPQFSSVQFSSVQLLSRVWLFETPCTEACQASLSIPTLGVYPNPCLLSRWWHSSPVMSFKIDWLDLLAVQGTLKSLLQHHCSKASILRHSAFFTVQLSHPYMTTGKTIALTRWILLLAK